MPPLNKCHIGNAENLIKAAAFNRINTVPCVLCVQVQCITKLTIRYKLTETVEYLHILHRKKCMQSSVPFFSLRPHNYKKYRMNPSSPETTKHMQTVIDRDGA